MSRLSSIPSLKSTFYLKFAENKWHKNIPFAFYERPSWDIGLSTLSVVVTQLQGTRLMIQRSWVQISACARLFLSKTEWFKEKCFFFLLSCFLSLIINTIICTMCHNEIHKSQKRPWMAQSFKKVRPSKWFWRCLANLWMNTHKGALQGVCPRLKVESHFGAKKRGQVRRFFPDMFWHFNLTHVWSRRWLFEQAQKMFKTFRIFAMTMMLHFLGLRERQQMINLGKYY